MAARAVARVFGVVARAVARVFGVVARVFWVVARVVARVFWVVARAVASVFFCWLLGCFKWLLGCLGWLLGTFCGGHFGYGPNGGGNYGVLPCRTCVPDPSRSVHGLHTGLHTEMLCRRSHAVF